VAAFVEAGGRGPFEWARVVPATDGSFTVHVGIASVGQGIATGLAQIAADALGVPLERVSISHQDTDEVPEGAGAFSSRSAVFGGNAVAGAVEELRRRARVSGAAALGSREEDVELVHGGIVRVRGEPARAVAFADLGCEGMFRFEKHERSFSMGAALVLARVDPETGEAAVERCVVACDVGRAINPPIVEGQLVGAAVQGLGGALLEELVYSEDGQPLTTSFLDYAMPGAAEVPRVEAIVLELPQHRKASANPLGIKGAGEGGIVAIGAAVANAVAQALGERGADLSALPVSPERLRNIVVHHGGA
jgi:carbon-monoxide dehydrogenase large subunit